MSVENLRSVMHIDPKEDVLYSIPDSDNHGDLLIRPQGRRMINELGDTVYIKDAFVPYHDHENGYETFLIDGLPRYASIRRNASSREGISYISGLM